jgi:carbamoyltransferase
MFYHSSENSMMKHKSDIYLGPKYNYTEEQLSDIVRNHHVKIKDATDADVVELMRNKNIVAMFQGSSENGPRALGNRSFMFDPTFVDGKDFVNKVKRREYFRPFAGSILQEDVHEWFDLRGMDSSPHMMYAVNCKPGIEEKIPSIIHVDHTCRIQTVTEEDNPLYHRLISEFKKQTGIPIIFNTSFNLGGDPLVETLDDAIDTLSKSDIEYLYLPEYGKLVTVANKNIIQIIK